MGRGIRDKVAILGMGCSKFGERWDAEPADLMAEAFEECVGDAGIERSQVAELTRRYGAPGEVDDDDRVTRICVTPGCYQDPHPPLWQAYAASESTIGISISFSNSWARVAARMLVHMMTIASGPAVATSRISFSIASSAISSNA